MTLSSCPFSSFFSPKAYSYPRRMVVTGLAIRLSGLKTARFTNHYAHACLSGRAGVLLPRLALDIALVVLLATVWTKLRNSVAFRYEILSRSSSARVHNLAVPPGWSCGIGHLYKSSGATSSRARGIHQPHRSPKARDDYIPGLLAIRKLVNCLFRRGRSVHESPQR